MYSLNVPVPADVARLATDLARRLPEARDRVRGDHSLVIKRFDGSQSYAHLEARVREFLAGQPSYEARVTRVDSFESAVSGPSPVVYLEVESPQLQRLHNQLVDEFGAVAGFEGENYVPHVTIARGGTMEMASRLAETPIDSIIWTVTQLTFRDGKRGESISRVSLPA